MLLPAPYHKQMIASNEKMKKWKNWKDKHDIIIPVFPIKRIAGILIFNEELDSSEGLKDWKLVNINSKTY